MMGSGDSLRSSQASYPGVRIYDRNKKRFYLKNKMEGENQLLTVILSPSHVYHEMCVRVHMHTLTRTIHTLIRNQIICKHEIQKDKTG